MLFPLPPRGVSKAAQTQLDSPALLKVLKSAQSSSSTQNCDRAAHQTGHPILDDLADGKEIFQQTPST